MTGQEVLYSLFEWAGMPGSSLVLLGIANALEMTNRFLPRLSAHDIAPKLLTFAAYTHDDLLHIIENRIIGNGDGDGDGDGDGTCEKKANDAVFQKPALQLLARKV